MFKIMTAEEAIMLIKDGDCIGINAFLDLNNPAALHRALYERYVAVGHPGNLTLLCAAGFGARNETDYAEPYINAGAVSRVIASHYATMPVTARKIQNNEIEGYALPLGVMSHTIRAMAGGQEGHLTKTGLGIYVDPRLDGPSMNSISKDDSIVTVTEVNGEEYLYYKLPKIDVAFIKGTAVDPLGNIHFGNEYVVLDAYMLAMAVKANGGKVIVQVDEVTHVFTRPRNVVVPGIFVDAVVVAEPEERHSSTQTLTGDIHVPPTHMDYWMNRMAAGKVKEEDDSSNIIGRRAAKELHPDDVVNVGIGLPENVARCASEMGILKDITLTVEAGGIGGLPAPGKNFGATIGADMIVDMATQFDMYDGGLLDICFMGGLEVDRHGNVNVHKSPRGFVGIGGFGNITRATKKVVFCLRFSVKGSHVSEKDGVVTIDSEGAIPKFRNEIAAVSFSASEALKAGHEVLYVTERCVFELTERGLRLKEVYPGIDVQKDILDHLDFPLCD